MLHRDPHLRQRHLDLRRLFGCTYWRHDSRFRDESRRSAAHRLQRRRPVSILERQGDGNIGRSHRAGDFESSLATSCLPGRVGPRALSKRAADRARDLLGKRPVGAGPLGLCDTSKKEPVQSPQSESEALRQHLRRRPRKLQVQEDWRRR